MLPPSTSAPLSLSGERVRAGRLRSQRHRPTDSYRFMRVLVVVLFIVTLDFTKVLDKGGASRYLLLLIPFGGAFLIKMLSPTLLARRPSFADKVLFVLMLFGGIGSIVGRVVLHTSSTALPIFTPMLVAFLYLLTVEDPTDEEVRKILIAIAAVGFLYVLLNAVANTGVIPTLKESRSYRNAEVMFIALGFAAMVITRRRMLLLVFVALAGFVFVTYPSGTSLLVTVVTLMTFFITRPHGTNVRFYVVGVIGLCLLVLALFHFSSTVGLATDYFSGVAKRDNTNTRIALWRAGLDKFARSPFVGDAFSGETTVLVFRQSGGRAPFHNPYNDDYILFASSGGVVALSLLLAWIAWIEITALRRYRGFVASGQSSHAGLIRALLVGFNGWLTAAAFNPLFQGLGRSVTLFCFYGLMMCLGRPRSGTAGNATRELSTVAAGVIRP